MEVFQHARFMIVACLCLYTSALLVFMVLKLKRISSITPAYSGIDDRAEIVETIERTVNNGSTGFSKHWFALAPTSSTLPLCPQQPPNLGGSLNSSFPSLANQAIKNLKNGGTYRPADCIARERTAVIIPYRDRQQHLSVIVPHLHTLLQRQQLQYGIFVVELELPTMFNRGVMANIGFEIASNTSYNYTCFIIHDVDMLPQDDRNLYRCGKHPRHLITSHSKFKDRKLPYDSYLGGVLAMTRSHFQKINGYSNLYFGWGGEDDDVEIRLREHNMTFERPSVAIGGYKAILHPRDKTNPMNPNRSKLVLAAQQRLSWDGLNNLRYTIKSKELRATYTWVLVHVEESELKKHA